MSMYLGWDLPSWTAWPRMPSELSFWSGHLRGTQSIATHLQPQRGLFFMIRALVRLLANSTMIDHVGVVGWMGGDGERSLLSSSGSGVSGGSLTWGLGGGLPKRWTTSMSSRTRGGETLGWEFTRRSTLSSTVPMVCSGTPKIRMEPRRPCCPRSSYLNKEHFCQAMSNISRDEISSATDTQQAFDIFHKQLVEIYNKHFPKIRIKRNYYNRKTMAVWWVKNPIKQNNKLYLKLKNVNSALNDELYKSYTRKL